MEAIDYIKQFRLDQENYEFRREEFLQQFGEEFLEYCQTTPIGRDRETGQLYYYRFKEVVKNFEIKFWSISKLKVGKPLTKRLWNAFFALYVVPFRDRHYPKMASLIRELKKSSNRAISPGKQDNNVRTAN